MADNKKYYYLKLKDNFFDSDEMIILESMADGYLYSNILLKLYLRSLKYEGRLMFSNKIPFNSTMLARVTRHSVGVIEKAMQVFRELELIEVLDSGAIYITDIQNFIGRSSTEADRKREYRKRIELEKVGQLEEIKEKDKCPDKSPPEREIEIEIELDIEKDIEKEKKSPPPPYKEIFELYNSICISLPKVIKLTDKRKKMIRSRYKEYDNLDIYKELFVKAEESDFLSGRNGKWTNCSFDWLMNENNMIKVLEGNYKNGGKDESRKGTKTNNGKSREKSLNELIKEELKRQGRTSL